MFWRLQFLCRWSGLEYTFGTSAQVMSEVSWRTLKALSFILDAPLCYFWVELLHHYAVLYAQCIAGEGDLLDHCVGFFRTHQNSHFESGRPASNQKACYSRDERVHCLVYWTTTKLSGLSLYPYRLEEGRRHDMNLYKKRDLEETMQDAIVIEAEQFCGCDDYGFVMRPRIQIRYVQSLAGPEDNV